MLCGVLCHCKECSLAVCYASRTNRPMADETSQTSQLRTASGRTRLRRVLLFAFLAIILLIVATLAVSSFWLRSYVHGEAFRKLLSQKTSAFLQAEGEYMAFHWSGFSVY